MLGIIIYKYSTLFESMRTREGLTIPDALMKHYPGTPSTKYFKYP